MYLRDVIAPHVVVEHLARSLPRRDVEEVLHHPVHHTEAGTRASSCTDVSPSPWVINNINKSDNIDIFFTHYTCTWIGIHLIKKSLDNFYSNQFHSASRQMTKNNHRHLYNINIDQYFPQGLD